MTQRENPAPLAGGRPGQEMKQGQVDVSTPRKWRRVLGALIDGRSFNRCEAERELHDHCLHSTVSTIQSKGVTIYRREDIVPGFRGMPTRVCRYWLPQENRERARVLLHEACPHIEPGNALQHTVDSPGRVRGAD